MKRTWILSSIVFAAACGTDAESPEQPGSPQFSAHIRGPLAETDIANAKTAHDNLVGATADDARAAGDVGHLVMLGTGESAGGPVPPDEFLAVDQWLTLEGATAVYGDPQFQAGFSSLFREPVMPTLFERRADWVRWGDITQSQGGEYYVMIVRGRLAKETEAENREAHDAVAGGFQEAAMQAGDIAHVPHLGVEDSRLFFNVDVSTSHEGLLGILQDPEFATQFGALFDGPPDVRIYKSTDWAQW
jgi:hypothetical protein